MDASRWLILALALVAFAAPAQSGEPETLAADAETELHQARLRLEDSCTWLQREYKDSLKQAREVEVQRELAAASAFGGADKQECSKLQGTARVHCLTGSDPHLGTIPAQDPCAQTPDQILSRVQQIGEAIGTLQGRLAPPRDEEGFGSRVTDLTPEQKRAIRSIASLKAERDTLNACLQDKEQAGASSGQGEQAKPKAVEQAKEKNEKESSKGWKRPVDYDCIRRPPFGPVCCPPER